MYKFTIPLKALSWNSAYKIARNKMILSDNGRKFKEYCSEFLKEQHTEDKLLEKDLKVKIIFQYKENRKKIDVDNGVIVNLTSGKEYKFSPIPPFMQELLKSGGLIEYAKTRI